MDNWSLFDLSLDQEKLEWDTAQSMKKSYQEGNLHWTTSEGEDILIEDLSTEHLQNIINFLNRIDIPNPITLAWIDIMKQEQINRN